MVAKVELLPQSENVFLIYKDGWHPAEVDAANPNSEWQWTQKRAAISFRNPKKDANFYLEYDARTDLFTPPQQVDHQDRRRRLDDLRGRLARTEAADPSRHGRPARDGRHGRDGIELDKTFKPGGADPRELGIRVFHAFIEPK